MQSFAIFIKWNDWWSDFHKLHLGGTKLCGLQLLRLEFIVLEPRTSLFEWAGWPRDDRQRRAQHGLEHSNDRSQHRLMLFCDKYSFCVHSCIRSTLVDICVIWRYIFHSRFPEEKYHSHFQSHHALATSTANATSPSPRSSAQWYTRLYRTLSGLRGPDASEEATTPSPSPSPSTSSRIYKYLFGLSSQLANAVKGNTTSNEHSTLENV